VQPLQLPQWTADQVNFDEAAFTESDAVYVSLVNVIRRVHARLLRPLCGVCLLCCIMF
jgi:hypothetical protein